MRCLAFLDLDLTLFDYTSAREGATYTALQAMGFDSNITDALTVMNSILIPHGDILVELGLPNFRRDWKSPELFALLALIVTRRDYLYSFRNLRHILDKIAEGNPRAPFSITGFWDRRQGRQLLHQVLQKNPLCEIRSILELVLQDLKYQEGISIAVAAFNTYLEKNVKSSNGVNRLLEALVTNSFETYILSEGDDHIQKDKISFLGLDRRTNGVFVSSACCQSERLLDWLWIQSLEYVEIENQELTNAIAIVYDEVLQYSNKSATLFRKVLHTALLPEPVRADFYIKFGWLSQKDCQIQEPIYILLFGDRYDKDLYPGIEAFKNVVSIRLLLGKYKQEYLPEVIAKAGLPKPTLTVNSVSKAAEFIESLSDQLILVPGEGAAPRSDIARIKRLEKAVNLLRETLDDIPSWVVSQLEGLAIALMGSEVSGYG